STDGSRIVSDFRNGTLRNWDTETWQSLSEPLRGHCSEVWSVAFSPDSSRIVSGFADGTLQIWDTETRQSLGEPLRGHRSGVWSVAFSPDGSRMVSGAGDGTLQIWDTETWQSLGEPLRSHDGGIWTLTFSLDGSHIVSGSRDHTRSTWDMKAISEGCSSPLSLGSFLTCIIEKESQKSPLGLLHPGKPYFSSSSYLSGTVGSEQSAGVWLCGPNKEQLLWFPSDWRFRLPVPYLLAIDGEKLIQFDFSTFHHGKEWTKCYTPQS
ncbi:quinon protein alcohol dehydrogenase-like superfamily, partial [Mycena capillaripes]